MTEVQRAQLVELIALYTGRLPPGHAALRVQEVKTHLHRTVFGWIGAFDPVSPFYYRIYSPVIFIEFYHQPGIALPNTGYNRRHGHTLVQTPNGNGYGWDLLRQHRPRIRVRASALVAVRARGMAGAVGTHAGLAERPAKREHSRQTVSYLGNPSLSPVMTTKDCPP
jgi:hypothetical protein